MSKAMAGLGRLLLRMVTLGQGDISFLSHVITLYMLLL